MATITADKVINKNIFAKGTVNAFDSSLNKIVKKFFNGALIGTVYSYINRPTGLYYIVYPTAYDYQNNTPVYIKHDTNLSLPALPAILQEITDQQERDKKNDKGLIQYNIDKYLPYIVGAVVVAVALPTITNSTKKIGAMNKSKKDDTPLLVLGGALIAAYFIFNKKKRKAGQPIVENLPGEFVKEVVQVPAEYQDYSINNSGSGTEFESANSNLAQDPGDTVIQMQSGEVRPVETVLINNSVNDGSGGSVRYFSDLNGNILNSNYIDYIGPFKTQYAAVNGVQPKRGDMGKLKTN